MFGLIEKDLCILKQRKSFFLLMFAIAAMLSFTTDGAFVVGYLTLLCSLFTLSTISYDEYDNCFAFLFTMPINEKIYVIEKYIFSFIIGIGSFVLAMVIIVVSGMVKGEMLSPEGYLGFLVYIPIGLLIVAFNVPVQLKFGQEKSRIVTLIIFGLFALAAYGFQEIITYLKLPVPKIVATMNLLPNAAWIVIGLAIVIFFVVISANVSISIMKKKEY